MALRTIHKGLNAFQDAASAWGVWPAIVMVLCQLETARIFAEPYPPAVAAITLAGTLTIYFADRMAERLLLDHLEARHRAHSRDLGFPVLIALLLVPAYLGRDQIYLPWLFALGLLGPVYLLVTTQLLKTPVLTKELLGGWIFATLVFEWADSGPQHLMFGFLPLAMANFLFSSHHDRERDRANDCASMAVVNPELNLAIARVLAMFTAGFFFQYVGWSSSFFWIAIAHAFWPTRYPIDTAFLPLLATPLLFFGLI